MKTFDARVGSDALPAVESFVVSDLTTNSPHIVGYWPLSHQNQICARDVSGNRRHFFSVNGNMSAIRADANGRLKPTGSAAGRLINSPTDPRFNLTNPGTSWLVTFVHRCSSSAGSLVVLGCGTSGGLYMDCTDNAGTTRFRVVYNGVTSIYSSNFPNQPNNDTHVALLRDAVAGRLYVYLNGVLDTGFNAGAGYYAYAPASAQATANLALCGYGANVTGSDMNAPGASNHTLGHLQLYMLPKGYILPDMLPLIAAMATDFTKMLTVEELP